MTELRRASYARKMAGRNRQDRDVYAASFIEDVASVVATATTDTLELAKQTASELRTGLRWMGFIAITSLAVSGLAVIVDVTTRNRDDA